METEKNKTVGVNVLLFGLLALGVSFLFQKCGNFFISELGIHRRVSYLGSLAFMVCFYVCSKVFSFAFVSEFASFTAKSTAPKE